MTKRLRSASLMVSLGLLAATAIPHPAQASDLAIPPIQYHQRTLPNGLQVLSVEDHASPNVAVQVWYHVGSKDELAGKTVLINLSGRGDKDVAQMMEVLG